MAQLYKSRPEALVNLAPQGKIVEFPAVRVCRHGLTETFVPDFLLVDKDAMLIF